MFAEMVEWFKAHAWKACDVNASAGSNPVLCANIFLVYIRIRTKVRPCRSDRAVALPALAKKQQNIVVLLTRRPCSLRHIVAILFY